MYVVTEPNDESAANVDAAKTWRENREMFTEIAHRTVKQSLGLWLHHMGKNSVLYEEVWPVHVLVKEIHFIIDYYSF